MTMFKQKDGSWWKRAETVLRHPYLTLFSRIALGGIFVFAGAAKIPHIAPTTPGATFYDEIMQYQMLPHQLATALAYTLPPIEVIIGLLLIFGILLKTSSALSGLMTLSFFIAKVSALARDLDIGICGCFGSLVPLLSTQTLPLDFVMLALALQIFFHRKDFIAFGPWMKGVVDRAKAEEKSSGTTPPPH
jgi:uncharacterized membrane protein YphA (DoxX/SURF4 family)